ncbi:hypothetical protein EJB05_27113, partial [Eragrostis curvula]
NAFSNHKQKGEQALTTTPKPMTRPQLRVLHALDMARTQLYHFRTVMIAGMGFFTDAYDLFSISLLADLIGDLHYGGTDYDGERLPRRMRAALFSVAFCGTISGELIFGWLGDKMGRKRVYGMTLILMVASSLASGLSLGGCMDGSAVIVLCFFRFWLGVGIGGDYPLSATIMSEYANKRRRGAFMAAIFTMQGFGILAAGIVSMTVYAAFRNSSRMSSDYIWRIVLMFGAIPAALTYYWRMKMPETARYTALIDKNANKAALDMSTVLSFQVVPEEGAVNELAREDQYGLFSTAFLQRHGIHLIGTSACWLLLDITFYSLNLFMEHTMVKKPSFNDGIVDMWKITAIHTFITLGGTLPGYILTVALVDRIGRIKIQLFGFFMMSIFTLCLAIGYNDWKHKKIAFGFLCGLTFFFANFGPNTTTFIIPAEIFPARLRSMCHGISGAAGKIGAIIGVLGFIYMNEQKMMYVLSGCNVIGLIFTFLLPESKGKSLEEITGEIVEMQLSEDITQELAAAEHIHIVPM